MRARERQSISALVRHQHLESFLFCQINHDARIVRIILDNEYHAVLRLDVLAVIEDLFDRPLGMAQLRQTMGRSVRALA